MRPAEHRPAIEIADEMIQIVGDRWDAHESFAPGDRNDVYLLLGYVRAFRCFDSIVMLAREGRNDDALVLLRSLVSVVLRSVYLVGSADDTEREIRRRRVIHEELVFEDKRLRAAAAPGEEGRSEEIAELLRHSSDWFDARGISPNVPDEASVARAHDLMALYDIVYRIASKTTHHSLFAMFTGFDAEPTENEPFPAVPLHKPTPELTENVVLWAIVVYAELLTRAEPILQIGVGSPIETLARPWLENHPYRVQGD